MVRIECEYEIVEEWDATGGESHRRHLPEAVRRLGWRRWLHRSHFEAHFGRWHRRLLRSHETSPKREHNSDSRVAHHSSTRSRSRASIGCRALHAVNDNHL